MGVSARTAAAAAAAAADPEWQHAPLANRAAARTLHRVSSAMQSEHRHRPHYKQDFIQETTSASGSSSADSRDNSGDSCNSSSNQPECTDACGLSESDISQVTVKGSKCAHTEDTSLPHPCVGKDDAAETTQDMAAAHFSSTEDISDSSTAHTKDYTADYTKDSEQVEGTSSSNARNYDKPGRTQTNTPGVQFQGSNSFNSTASSSGRSNMMDPLLMVDNLAKPGGNTDVYAYFVYSTFRASSRWQLVQAIVGMLVTFLMQAGIIVLLWYGVIATMHKSAANQVVQTPLELDVSWRTVNSSAEMPLAIVNMLVVLALSVYALEEVRHAVSLSITAAACLELLPPFYGGEHFSSCSSAGRGLRDMCYGTFGGVAAPVLRCLVLAAPILQHIIALLVLVSAVDLTFLRSQTDIISIILDAAALVFLLELDTRVGTVLLNQHTRAMPQFDSSTAPCSSMLYRSTSLRSMHGDSGSCRQSNAGTNRSCSNRGLKVIASYRKMLSMGQGKLSCKLLPAALRTKLGHAYIGLVGLLMLCEPLLLSSVAMLGIHMSWLVPLLPGGLMAFKHNRGPLTLWTLYGNEGICIMLSCKGTVDQPILQDSMPVVLAVFYPLLVMAMVLLLCGNMLPSVSNKWNRYVLATQVVLGLLPHMVACVSRAMLLLLPVIVLLSWLSLFVLWPLLWGLLHMCDKLYMKGHKACDTEQVQQHHQELPQLRQHSAVVLHIPAGSAQDCNTVASGKPQSSSTSTGCMQRVCKDCGGLVLVLGEHVAIQ